MCQTPVKKQLHIKLYLKKYNFSKKLLEILEMIRYTKRAVA